MTATHTGFDCRCGELKTEGDHWPLLESGILHTKAKCSPAVSSLIKDVIALHPRKSNECLTCAEAWPCPTVSVAAAYKE